MANGDTLSMSDANAIQAALKDLDSVHQDDCGRSTRKNSACSHTSARSGGSWSSGKPLPAPPIPTKKGKIGDFFKSRWHDRQKRRQWIMWITFALVLIVTAILAIGLIARFTSPIGEELRTTDVENGRVGGRPDQKPERLEKGKGGELIMLLGGKIGSGLGGPRSTEVISHQGSCNLPEGFPAPLPEVRVGNIVGSTGQIIISCGGIGVTLSGPQVPTNICWSYSPTSNTWTALRENMPVEVTYAAGIVLGNEFWVLGGNNQEGMKTAYTQILNTATMTWRLGKIDLPVEIWGHCALKINKFSAIIVTGGWSQDQSSLKSATYIRPYEGDNPKWLQLPPMIEGRATHGCATTKYKGSYSAIVVAGGMGAHNGPLNSVEVLPLSKSLTSTGWVQLANLSKRRSWYPAVAALSRRLIVAAGKNIYGEGEASIEEFDPVIDSWRTLPESLKQSRFGGQNVQLPATLFPFCIR